MKSLNLYAVEIETGIARILCALNLDRNSSSFGSFDRHFWSWKRRDFQDSTLSFAILPLLKAIKIVGSKFDKNLVWESAIESIKALQHKNGSFDQSYPFEGHPKTGLDFGEVLYSCLKEHTRPDIERVYKNLIEFSMTAEEDYGVICNHLAHDAYQYLLAWDHFRDRRYYKKAADNIATIGRHTHAEGWHLEYLGADAGYQSRALKYLTKCIPFLEPEQKKPCLQLCYASGKFLDKAVLPDGTLYSGFGSRNTALLYPSGLEFLARNFPGEFVPLLLRVRRSVEGRKALLPNALDFDNFIRLFDDFLDAETGFCNRLGEQEPGKPDPKDIELSGFDLPAFGLRCLNLEKFSLYFHYKNGGCLALYQGPSLLCKDGGFLIEDQSSHWHGMKNLQAPSEGTLVAEGAMGCHGQLFSSLHQDLSSLKLVILRVLNLTFLRISWIANLFRKIIVRTLIVGKNSQTAGHFERSVQMSGTQLTIVDKVQLKVKPKRIYRVLAANLFHMASSRYAHPCDTGLAISFEEKPEIVNNSFSITRVVNLK